MGKLRSGVQPTIVILLRCYYAFSPVAITSCFSGPPGNGWPASNRQPVITLHEKAVASDTDILSRISYRPPTADEIPACFDIESASYPSDEAATLESLLHRQANALGYFQCAVLDSDAIIGFCCATRCELFEEESMSTHDASGRLLAIHSVVVKDEFRHKGIASGMLKAYVDKVQQQNNGSDSIRSIVLLAKSHLLGFYGNCGFQVNGPSPIVHGKELWYELELPLTQVSTQPSV